MKINWCEQHSSQAHPDYKHHCWASQDDAWLGGDCRFVPMRLIPDNAETVEREALDAALKKWYWLAKNGTTESVLGFLAKNEPEVGITLAEAARAYLALDGETP